MAVLYGVYAAVLLVGGVLGYRKAQSVPSLAAGIVGAVLMGIAAFLLHTQPHTGLGIGVFTSLVLFIAFAFRLRKTGKAMPTPLLVALKMGLC